MSTFGPTSDTVRFVTNLSALPEEIRLRLEQANLEIVTEMQIRLPAIYTPRLAAKWQVHPDAVNPPVATKVTAETDAKEVMGYEFGTRPHEIRPRNKRALAFQVSGQQVIVQRVQHPGTHGHHQRETVLETLAQVAREFWEAALDQTLRQV